MSNAKQTTGVSQVYKKPVESKAHRFWRENKAGWGFLLPFMILFLVFTVLPVFVAMGLSFTDYNMIQTPNFTGLTNYRLLLLEDDVFIIALQNTLLFSCIIGPAGYIMSFVMAWFISLCKRGRGALALAFYAPSLTSGTAMSVIWLVIFSGDRYGYLNHFLIELGLISDPILWCKDSNYILLVIVVISAWMSMGTGFLVFLAGLQNVDPELYEAGKVDGIHNPLQQLWYITLPLMKPQLLFGAINSIVNSLAVFDVATAVAGFPSPNYAAHTIVAHLYDYAFTRFQMGYASAVAMFLFLLSFGLSRICMRIFRSDD
ncbi:MAG: carbohydrate ABC transporter permease [Lachnospiraceae bacterium]